MLCRLAIYACALTLVMSALQSPVQAASASAQAQLKAALIFNVSKLARFPNPGPGLSICTSHAQDEVSLALRALDGRHSQGRLVSVRRGVEVDQLQSCDVAYFSRDEADIFRDWQLRLNTHSVLSISDIDNFASAGGIVGIVADGDRLSLEINNESARRANIGFAAQLLSLAKIIRSEVH